jgi:hypothetical protein
LIDQSFGRHHGDFPGSGEGVIFKCGSSKIVLFGRFSCHGQESFVTKIVMICKKRHPNHKPAPHEMSEMHIQLMTLAQLWQNRSSNSGTTGE